MGKKDNVPECSTFAGVLCTFLKVSLLDQEVVLDVPVWF